MLAASVAPERFMWVFYRARGRNPEEEGKAYG
jgi:hypothetical protein